MAQLDILTYPDERLKAVSEPVTAFTAELDSFIDDLIETMYAGPGGVGIAAPQVGRAQRIVIVDVSAKPDIPNHGLLVMVNPEITKWKGMKKGREGCLSVPDYIGSVIRAETISVRAQSRTGEALQFKFEGYEARAVQHEIDHLDGLLFLDRLVSRHHDLMRRKPSS